MENTYQFSFYPPYRIDPTLYRIHSSCSWGIYYVTLSKYFRFLTQVGEKRLDDRSSSRSKFLEGFYLLHKLSVRFSLFVQQYFPHSIADCPDLSFPSIWLEIVCRISEWRFHPFNYNSTIIWFLKTSITFRFKIPVFFFPSRKCGGLQGHQFRYISRPHKKVHTSSHVMNSWAELIFLWAVPRCGNKCSSGCLFVFEWSVWTVFARCPRIS